MLKRIPNFSNKVIALAEFVKHTKRYDSEYFLVSILDDNERSSGTQLIKERAIRPINCDLKRQTFRFASGFLKFLVNIFFL